MLLDTDTQRPGNISRAPLHGSSALGTAVPFRRSLAQGSIEREQSKTRESRRRRHHQAPRASVARAERIRRAVYGLASCITRYEVATSRYRNLELDSTRRVPSLITLRFASTRYTRTPRTPLSLHCESDAVHSWVHEDSRDGAGCQCPSRCRYRGWLWRPSNGMQPLR